MTVKENRYIEYKATVTNTFLKTVSAFSNCEGGRIIFGIADDGTVTGVDDPKNACMDIENRINDSISPKPDYTLDVNDEKHLVILSVAEGRFKPYFYHGKAYRRSDTASVEMDQIELRRLVLESENLYFEQLSCGEENLQFTCLEKKLKEVLGIESLTSDMLKTFGFFSKEGKWNNAGALIADENHFPGIDVARFGSSINEIRERETFAGISILKQYDEVITMYRRNYRVERIEGIERKTIELVPESAYREAVANALVHRTWDINAHTRISMFPDRIEVASPGGLPKGLSEKDYLTGTVSSLRNPVIANVFFRLGYIEAFGTGIRRIQEAYAHSGVSPSFTITDNAIVVTLPVIHGKHSITLDEKAALDVLGTNMLMSTNEISQLLGWSKDKTIRVINALKSIGRIESVGNGRATKYRSL